MTVRDDFDRMLSTWLDEMAGAGAPDYLDETLDGLERIGQRPAWMSPWRWLPMQLTMPRVYIPRALPILAVIAIVIAALVVAALIVGSQPRLPPPFGLARTGLLVYDRAGDIYVQAPDGQPRALLEGPEFVMTATWARDGKRFAFWAGELGTMGELRVSDATGENVKAVANGVILPSLFMPQSVSWSPDGTRLAFSSGDGVMEIVNADGTDRHKVGDDSQLRFDPAWSPDGQLIAFRGQESPSMSAIRQAYVIRPDGTAETQVSRPSVEANSVMAPSWSMDGRLLYDAVFDRSIAGNLGDIVVATQTGGQWEETIIIRGPTTDWLPRWSNDATRIVFLRSPSTGEGDQYVVDANGSGLRKLSDRIMSTGGACWSPDDTKIAALTGEEGRPINGQAEARYIVYDANTGQILQEIPVPGVQGVLDCSWQRLAP